MKPAGVERDKQIAEMRGETSCDKWQNVNRGSAGGFGYMNVRGVTCEHDKCYSAQMGPSKYSTDISCAMELMGEHGKLTWHWSDEYGYYAHAEIHSIGPHWSKSPTRWGHESEYYKSLEYAIADAISGAWIKWKEAK